VLNTSIFTKGNMDPREYKTYMKLRVESSYIHKINSYKLYITMSNFDILEAVVLHVSLSVKQFVALS
jgi:hypothetical protein